MKNIAQLQKEIYENAVSKGFYETPPNRAERLMLVVSELSEALEADRKGNEARLDLFDIQESSMAAPFEDTFKGFIKDTFADELADAMIRIMDMAQHEGIDLQRHIELKMRYNAGRPFKHGKKY